MRLRTASDGNILRLFVDSAGTLRLQSDVTGAQSSATVPLGLGAWRDLEVCGSVGGTGSWSLYRDGTRVLDGWIANTGTTAIGRIELGDFNARTWSARFDSVIVDQSPGEDLPVMDTTPPTAPGQPTGTSPAGGTIQLSWAASTDPAPSSPPITYRIYRDADPDPIGETTATSYTDAELEPGSVHTYAVDAVDAADNESGVGPVSAPITVFEDLTPPTAPGQPTGTSPAAGEIALSWAASTDPVPSSPPITYRIYRDADPDPIGETTATSYTDAGLDPGSVHTYAVDAVDAADNESGVGPASAPITVISTPPAIFADDFSSGTLAGWTGSTRITIDAAQGSPAAPSARAQVSSQSAWAYRSLGATYASACMSVRVNAASLGGNAVDLFRLRTASDGPIARAYVTASGVLYIRADVSGAKANSGVVLGSGWHTVELCGTVGSATSWDLLRDGVVIVNDWVANTGTTPVGRVQIGDTAAKTFTVNFDDVRLDQVAG
jgi:hypothetical protein